MLKARRVTLALSAVLLGAISPCVAADATRGGRLAQQWCAGCHLIGGPQPGTAQQGPPSFPTVAGRLSPEQLRAFLAHPHGAMPDLALSRTEIDDLIAYIGTLR